MFHFIVGAVSTATALYSICSTTESLCKGLDNYVDKNVDIITDSPLLGHKSGTIKLRCKSERRMVHEYNKLVASLTEVKFGKSYKNFEDKKDWTAEELQFLFRLGTSLENWWVEGLAGQFFSGQETLDPRTVSIMKSLSKEQRLLIADVQVLIQYQPK